VNKILISACLMGENVRYDGRNSQLISDTLQQWQQQGCIVSSCPEVIGGLPVPRLPAELERGDAGAVLQGRSAIKRKDGTDVTDAFIEGAEKTLALCMQHHIRIAILKEGSPSCGVLCVNDGSFSGRKINGQGITACLLTLHGIFVFNERQIGSAAQRLNELESSYG